MQGQAWLWGLGSIPKRHGRHTWPQLENSLGQPFWGQAPLQLHSSVCRMSSLQDTQLLPHPFTYSPSDGHGETRSSDCWGLAGEALTGT